MPKRGRIPVCVNMGSIHMKVPAAEIQRSKHCPAAVQHECLAFIQISFDEKKQILNKLVVRIVGQSHSCSGIFIVNIKEWKLKRLLKVSKSFFKQKKSQKSHATAF